MSRGKKRIYLDYAASTPVDSRVFEAMQPYFTEKFGNPGSLHSFGQEAIAAVDKSRETIAKTIGRPAAAGFREIIFTGSATEANNLALRGAVRRFTQMTTQINADKNISDHQRHISVHPRPRLIVSAIEHESILETARDLERDGVEVIYVPVDRRGVVDLEKLKAALNPAAAGRTVLVSIMYANNEIGTVQPIREISEIIRNFRKESNVNGPAVAKALAGRQMSNVGAALPLFHTDAAQAFQFLDCDVAELGVDLMTLSAHKIYGPKGIGALFMRQSAPRGLTQMVHGTTQNNFRVSRREVSEILRPLVAGGGQEFGLRSGTENVPLIVGFAKAAELLFSNSHELENKGVELLSNFRRRRTGAPARRSIGEGRELESKRIGELRDYFWKGLVEIYPKAEINGCENHMSPVTCHMLPSILNIYFPDHLAEDLLTKFDLAGLAVSSGSACRSRAVESSYVIEALGYSQERAKRSIRFSFGRPTTKMEVDRVLQIVRKCLRGH